MTNKKVKKEYSPQIAEALNHIEELKLSGEHKQSILEAEKLLFEDPNCVEALEEIADNYVSLDDYEKAKKACARALKLDKNSYTAKYILGFIHSNNRNWEDAATHLKSANSLHANNPEILRCLGWALFNLGKHTQGIVILERSLNIDPENTLTMCDLGVCYMQMKNFEKSIELLKKAMEIDPNNQRVHECFLAAQSFQNQMKKILRPMKK